MAIFLHELPKSINQSNLKITDRQADAREKRPGDEVERR